jgi:hypothetical protein
MLSQQEMSVHEGRVEIRWRLQVEPLERQYPQPPHRKLTAK